MTDTVVSYFAATPQNGRTLLGTETASDGMQLMIPNWSTAGPKVTITKFFKGHPSHRWLVTKVDPNPNAGTNTPIWEVDLEPWTDCVGEEFLAQTRKWRRNLHLRSGTLVEVDFGHIQLVTKVPKPRSNKRYPDTVQDPEMHKRRLCIVLFHDKNRVQVVPLSSKEPEDSRGVGFELPVGELNKLQSYNDPCYVLPDMIQTVSARRILPPKQCDRRSRTRTFRDKEYRHWVSPATMAILKEKLLLVIQRGGLTEELKVARQRVETLKTAKEAAKQERDVAIAEKAELGERLESFKKLLINTYLETIADNRIEAEALMEQEFAKFHDGPLAIVD